MFEVASTHQMQKAQKQAHVARAQAFVGMFRAMARLARIPLISKPDLTVAFR